MPQESSVSNPSSPKKAPNRWNIFLFVGLIFFSIFLALFLSLNGIFQDSENTPTPSKEKGGFQFSFGSERNGAEGVVLLQVFGLIDYQKAFPKIQDTLRKIEKEPQIHGLILEINSPGGTLGGSQAIYQEIVRFREKTSKPVVAIMGDIATSGAYYISSPCDYIVAQPGTLTGSIGVILNSLDVQKLLRTLGIESRVVKSGKFKDLFSPTRDVEAEEWKILQDIVMESYDQFSKDILNGRKGKISSQTLKKYADGRIFTGTTAKNIGLIDEIGGIDQALLFIQKERKLKNIPQVFQVEEELIQQLFKILKFLPQGQNAFSLWEKGWNQLNEEQTKAPQLLRHPF